MNFNINIMNYIRSWVNMNGLYMRHDNIYDVTEGGNTNFNVILQTNFVIKHSEDACVKLFDGAFVWSEMCKEPMSYAEVVINEVKKTLNKYKDTDDTACLYPKTLTPDEYRDKKIDRLKRALNTMYGRGLYGICQEIRNKPIYTPEEVEHLIKARGSNPIPAIDKVIFNDPATIVFWKDGTKTVVKAQDGEVYDDEKGLAMAISKKALGNQGNYYNTFDKYLIRPEEEDEVPVMSLAEAANKMAKAAHDLGAKLKNATEGIGSEWSKTYLLSIDKTVLQCNKCRNIITHDGDLKDTTHFPCPNCYKKDDNK